MATSLIRSKKYTINSATDVIIEIPDIASVLMNVPATNTGQIWISMENEIIATPTDLGSTTFTDNNPNPDTITRTTGSWIQDKFVVGMSVTFAGTVSNNVTRTITAVTDKVLTVSSTLTNEVVATAATATGLYDDATVWFLYNTTAGAATLFLDKELEFGPKGLRFRRSAGAGTIQVWVKS